jgi:hypothetical protein
MAVAGLVCANSGYARPNVDIKNENNGAIMSWFSTLLSGGASAKGGRAEPPECYDRNGRAIYSGLLCERLARDEANPNCLRFPPGQCPTPQPPSTCRSCTSDPDPGP